MKWGEEEMNEWFVLTLGYDPEEVSVATAAGDMPQINCEKTNVDKERLRLGHLCSYG